MYCANCGVKLAESEAFCPLCQTKAYHPDLPPQVGAGLYPKEKQPQKQRRSPWPQMIVTAAFVLAMVIVLLCDFKVTGSVTWSGFVLGALGVFYVAAALPVWFRAPNPVIFVPCSFAAAAFYLLYICLYTGGHWFMTFALPVTAAFCAIITAVTVLFKYVKGGRLYIIGGALVVLGGVMLLTEWLIALTFHVGKFAMWSLYPMTALVLVGALLIFLAVCRPARETMERKLFI